MKGVSALIVIVMILLITLSLFILVYTFVINADTNFRSDIETKQDTQMRQYGSSLSIIYTSATQGKVTVYNDGKWELSNLGLYVNDKRVNITSPSRIEPGETVNLTFTPMASGNYIYKVTSDYAKAITAGQ